jgi:glucuronate isomerase
VTFLGDDFLLQTKTARRLYEEYAAPQPVLDYHNHLPPRDIAENRRFRDLFEIWLEGDHYKWRAMRASGEDERYCTGDAPPFEKFLAWARTVPHCLRNPLYHWTHLELRRYFDIDDLLDAKSARAIWDRASTLLQHDDLSAQGILRKFNVAALCTTDDPADSLEWHEQIRASSLATQVYPTFRPDRALEVHTPAAFNPWVDRLAAAANVHVATLADFERALSRRHEAFHDVGGRLSDHGVAYCPASDCDAKTAAAIFDKARAGAPCGPEDADRFASYMMLFFGRLDAEKGWTKQLHLGALRNVNSRMLASLGANTGYDSIGDWPQAQALGRYLDRLDADDLLPKMVIYNVNPADNYVFGTMTGNFQRGSMPGKIQFGSSWWFLDQKDGIEWQLDALSNVGLLSHFVGMLTDSRSFMSYPRHEYFRRVLCNLLGREMENGQLPDREDLVGALIENVCYRNAARFLGLGQKMPMTTHA